MPVGDAWGTYATPCPNCGGKVKYEFYGADCRGNPPSGSIYCSGKCKRKFTMAEWKLIAREEMKAEQRKEQVASLAWRAKDLANTLSEDPKVATKLRDELFKGTEPKGLKDPAAQQFHKRILEYAKAHSKLA